MHPKRIRRIGGMRTTLRNAKAGGMTAAEAWKILEDGRRQAAKENHWRESELIVALTCDWEDLEAVFGKRATSLL